MIRREKIDGYYRCNACSSEDTEDNKLAKFLIGPTNGAIGIILCRDCRKKLHYLLVD